MARMSLKGTFHLKLIFLPTYLEHSGLVFPLVGQNEVVTDSNDMPGNGREQVSVQRAHVDELPAWRPRTEQHVKTAVLIQIKTACFSLYPFPL